MTNFLIWLCTVDTSRAWQFQEFLINGTNGHDGDQGVDVPSAFTQVALRSEQGKRCTYTLLDGANDTASQPSAPRRSRKLGRSKYGN
jgi:hypothetical protein